MDLTVSRPTFLDLLESEPERAKVEFYAFAQEVFRRFPPRIAYQLAEQDREDVFQGIILRCLRDDCRFLRDYEDRGVPFAGLLVRMAFNASRDFLDRIRPASLDDSAVTQPVRTGVHSSKPDWSRAVAAVRSCLSHMTPKDQLLITLLADQYTPQEIVSFLVSSRQTEGEESVYQPIRTARRRLRTCLEDRGIDLSALFAGR